MNKKTSTAEILGACLVWGGIGILMGLRYISMHFPRWGGLPFFVALLMLGTGFTLWQWKENRYRFDINSLPPLVIVFGSLILFAVFIQLNLQICRFRLGGMPLSVRWLPTMLTQLFVVGAGIFIHMAGYPPPPARRPAGRTWAAIIFSAATAVGLNFLFHSRIGDLTTTLRSTQRCYPGGTCYDVGLEAWGGTGATILLGINLLQILLIINALYGAYVLLFSSQARGASS